MAVADDTSADMTQEVHQLNAPACGTEELVNYLKQNIAQFKQFIQVPARSF